MYVNGELTQEIFIRRVFQLMPPTMTVFWFGFVVAAGCCALFSMYTVWSLAHTHTHARNGNDNDNKKTVDLLFKRRKKKKLMKRYSISTRSLVHFFARIHLLFLVSAEESSVIVAGSAIEDRYLC